MNTPARTVPSPDDPWRARAAAVIPGGSSTGSKRPDALYGAFAADAVVPSHYERAAGCRVWTTDGREFVDCGMALGAVGIGYADPAVTAAVQAAALAGPVSSLPHRLEVEVAEALVQVIPSAQRVRFLRTGAEATNAAVRLARTLTARERIVACGYFGWLDWNSDAAGVPAAARELVSWVPFGDSTALAAAVRGGDAPAAIVLEPLVHDIAPREWLATARELANAVGALLIFDEVKTAFRVRTGGVQALHGITPDLTVIGKAFANGYPLSAVVGRADAMDAAQRTWISSTAAAEATGLAAARAVLTWHAQHDVCARMDAAGGTLRDIIGAALHAEPWTGVRAEGPNVMWRLVSAEPAPLDALVAAAARHGVLLKRGAYQFGAVAHDDRALDPVRRAMPPLLDSLHTTNKTK
ncbi:MAG: aminotransferase class III-fold pyridoxal phosphate-dependent enzyme [Gemmatimonas sp.]|uniref:aminotransferase class III-fold pyridoxal phosphate-dependent enzyme n=2 Tax=Gemmatimonas sp. TaxID=1962908 RepID=UPI00391FBA82